MNQQMYTTAELAAMTPDELRVAQANGFVKSTEAETTMAAEAAFSTEAVQHPVTFDADIAAAAERDRRNQGRMSVDEAFARLPEAIAALPGPPAQLPYAPTSWGEQFFDFTVPSGQTCQMRKLRPEQLIDTGILDQITRLPAFADENIRRSEGQPPTPTPIPGTEDFRELIKVLNTLVPLVVVQPSVLPDPEDGNRVPGQVYLSDIELMDRIAIMDRAMQGVTKLDNFREKP